MASLKELAIELATVNLVADLVAERKEQLRDEITNAFVENGSDSLRVSVEDEKIGKVSLVEPKTKAIIENEVAFLHWVLDNHKNEIVSEIRPSFKKYVVDNIEIFDDGTAVLKTTGEVVDGVTGRKSAPYVSTRFESDGREKLGKAIATGKVAFALPSITKEIEG